MRQAEQDGEHIWLRQSVTFTANGQTRTVEMAIPLRPGAPAEDMERLLAEAEAGMHRLSQRLDSHVAALLSGTSAPATPAISSPSAPAPESAVPAAPVTPSAPALAPAARSAEAQRPQVPATPAHPAARPERPAPAATQAPATPARPAPAPSSPPAPPARARSSGPLAAPLPATPAPTSAAPSIPAPASGELSRKDFLAATTEMGLTVKQVMERLRVRSLEGLNLREALEALRRQMLRDGETPPSLSTSPAAAPSPAASAAPTPGSAAPAAANAPRYFEEEDDDYDVTFTMDGDDALAEEFGPYEAAGVSNGASLEASYDLEDPGDLSEFDLDDVPDFGPPPSAAHASHPAPHPAPAPARRNAPAKAAPTLPPPPVAPPAGEPEPELAASPVSQRITQLRTVRGGGAPTTHQRSAYRNIVVNELGDEATALVRGIWRINPERLGPEQLDALISWGKADTFAEEAADVIAALRAERQQAAATPEDASAASSPAPRPAPRSRPAQPPRAPSGGH